MKLSVIQLLVGICISITFVLSAIFKFQSLEEFELYIFSSQIFSYHLSTFIARIIIASEFILGGLLLIGVMHRYVCLAMMLMLLIFSTYLLWLVFSGNTDNCHCFGNMTELSSKESLVKNLILFVGLFFILKKPSIHFPQRKIFTTVIVTVPLIFTFVINQPDYTSLLLYDNDVNYSEAVYHQSIKEGILDSSLLNGKHILMFSSLQCKYCFFGIQKLYLMIKDTPVMPHVNIAFIGGDTTLVDSFFIKSKVPPFPHTFLQPKTLLQMTNGGIPLFFFIDNGRIRKALTYISLTEKEIEEFWEKEYNSSSTR